MSRAFVMWTAVSITACSYTPPDPGPTPDGPDLPTVSFLDPTSLVDEKVVLLKIPIVLSEPSTSAVDFKVTGTAVQNTDFAFVNGSTAGTLTFAGDTQDIELMFSMDNLEEPDETIEITLENPQGANLGAQITHVVTISADILPRVKFSSPATNRDEDQAGAKLDLELDVAPVEPVSIDIVLGGGATAVTDYGLIGQTVTFAIGQQTAQLDFAVVPDTRDELDEIVAIDLATPIGVVIDSSASHTEHTIKDDDASPSVSFMAAANSLSEGIALADQIVRLSAASNLVVTVQYAVTGGSAAANDVTLGGNGTLTFQPGVTEQTLPIAIVADNRDELDTETVQITLSNPSNATVGTPGVHTLTIVDDDAAPTVAFAVASSAVTEGDPAFNVTVDLVGETDLTVTVNFARNPASTAALTTDFTINPATQLTFAPGVTAQNITVTIVDDTVGELEELLILDLTGFTNATAGATTTHSMKFNDDDCLGTGNFRVCLATPPTGDVTLSGAFNTDSSPACAAQQPIGWTTTFGQPAACFVAADDLAIDAGGLQVTGGRPLVLVGGTSVTIVGVLDASANSITNGPGGPSSLCNVPAAIAASSADGGGGGAGASFMSQGGDGGNGNNNTVAGSDAPVIDAADPTILRGGCRGAGGGTGPGAAGTGGGAGGAVYLVAPTITIGGTIDVSGSGGRGGASDAGGAGGAGAGGTIFLDATTLDLSGTLMSNGGGAGQGADNNTTGQNGGDPASPNVAALGGNVGGAGGRGGNGFVTGTAAQAGTNGGSGQGAGGGGGGGGFIASSQSLANGTVSAGKIVD